MADHAAALAEVQVAVRAVPAARWAMAPAPGKWSAAEVAQHLILAYEHLTREQNGGSEIRVLPSRWRAWMLRQFVLPRLLAGRPLPAGVRAPREVRPGGHIPVQEEAVAALDHAADAWCVAMASRSSDRQARATHPFFGAIPLLTMVRFTILHLRHHCRQIERAGMGLPLRDT